MKVILVFLFLLFHYPSYSQNEINVYFIDLLNEYRKSNGLNEVKYSILCDSASKLHSDWMRDNEKLQHHEYKRKDGNFFYSSHCRLKNYDSDWESKYDKYYTLENCAYTISYDSITKNDVHKIFNMWKKSPGHNRALLSKDITHTAIFLSENREHYKTLRMIRIYSTAVFLKQSFID